MSYAKQLVFFSFIPYSHQGFFYNTNQITLLSPPVSQPITLRIKCKIPAMVSETLQDLAPRYLFNIFFFQLSGEIYADPKTLAIAIPTSWRPSIFPADFLSSLWSLLCLPYSAQGSILHPSLHPWVWFFFALLLPNTYWTAVYCLYSILECKQCWGQWLGLVHHLIPSS